MNELVINDPETRKVIVDLLRERIRELSNILAKLEGTQDDDDSSEPKEPSPKKTIGKRKKNKGKQKYRYTASFNDIEKILKKHGNLSAYRIRELLKDELNVSVTDDALNKLLKRPQISQWLELDDESGKWRLSSE